MQISFPAGSDKKVVSNQDLGNTKLSSKQYGNYIFDDVSLSCTDISSCVFEETSILNSDLTDADLELTDFLRSKIIGCSLSMADIKMGDFRETVFVNTLLDDVKVFETEFNTVKMFSTKTAGKPSMIGALFSDCVFKGVVFENVDMRGAQFLNCNFEDTTFLGCLMTYTIFDGCSFKDSKVDKSNCTSLVIHNIKGPKELGFRNKTGIPIFPSSEEKFKSAVDMITGRVVTLFRRTFVHEKRDVSSTVFKHAPGGGVRVHNGYSKPSHGARRVIGFLPPTSKVNKQPDNKAYLLMSARLKERINTAEKTA